MFQPCYLDHNATTPVAQPVIDAMLPFLGQRYGNPSSRHEHGRVALRALDEARQQVAAAVNAQPNEVIFVSGGTEANNLFLRGVAALQPAGLIAVSATEHPSVRLAAQALRRTGWQVREIAVDGSGIIDTDAYMATLQEQPAVISVMLANNETGVIQEVAALARQSLPNRTLFHVDAVQALGKLPVDFRRLNAAGIHAITLSAHKIGGPKGVGALILDRRVELAEQIVGGGQERGMRSGTENLPAIVGFGLACSQLAARGAAMQSIEPLRDTLEAGLIEFGATIYGRGAPRLANTSFFTLPGIDGETLVARLDRAGYAVASGAACSSANPEPSHVLLAMGVRADSARGAVRVSLGPDTAATDIQGFLAALAKTLEQLRGLTALAA